MKHGKKHINKTEVNINNDLYRIKWVTSDRN